jgi:hypothetical protein
MNGVNVLQALKSQGSLLQIQARAEAERRRRKSQNEPDPYQFDPAGYIIKRLGWTPWAKQREIIDAYNLALRQQHERDAFEKGEIALDGLKYWQPGQVIRNWISVDAGHNVGKTKLAAGLVSHFFDNFKPSIGYCFAPSEEQINDLLFKEIRVDRRGKGLPGEVMEEPRIKYQDDHFVKGKATNNAKGTGTERSQGQHGKYLIFVLDEAEGIPGFVWDAVESMASGGICMVLVLRNPRTTTCRAHKIRKQQNCATFRISQLEHPNVLENKEIIPGSVRRQYVLDMLQRCEVVDEHNPDDYTFELPWQPGVIYRPSLETLWRVLGLASAKGIDDTFCPPGRYEAALTRLPYEGDDPEEARLGVDAARYGNDKGAIYVRHAGRVWKDKEIIKQDGFAYYLGAKEACRKLKEKGVKRVKVRVDAGGGYHSTCVDNLRRDADLKEWFETFEVYEVHNNGTPCEPDKFADLITEMYYHAGEALKVLRLDNPPPDLEVDLCERQYHYVIKTSGDKTRLDLKQLVSKEKFKDKYDRSPDDGDGLALATAPDRLFINNQPSGLIIQRRSKGWQPRK